jgi:ribosomal protein S18 acetylase RimI-like enzyme
MGLEYQPDGLQSDTRKIREIYFNNGGFFWVAKDNNSIVGSIALKMINLDKRIGEIKRYFVLPSVQNKGIGSMLMEQLIVKAQKSGLKRLRLDTMKDSTNALSIYRKFGFKEIEKYNDNDIAEIFMELAIS